MNTGENARMSAQSCAWTAPRSVLVGTHGQRCNTRAPRRRALAALSAVVALSACAPGTRLFQLGPRPAELVGTWVDSTQATQTDSVAWILAGNGAHRRLHIAVRQNESGQSVTTREERGDGQWYMAGTVADTMSRAFCVSRRSRSAPSCVPFRLDTLPVGGPVTRRRLTILRRGDRAPLIVLLERLP